MERNSAGSSTYTHAGITVSCCLPPSVSPKVLFQLLITYFSHTDTLQRDKHLLQPSTEIAWHVFQPRRSDERHKLCVFDFVLITHLICYRKYIWLTVKTSVNTSLRDFGGERVSVCVYPLWFSPTVISVSMALSCSPPLFLHYHPINRPSLLRDRAHTHTPLTSHLHIPLNTPYATGTSLNTQSAS